MEGTRRILFFLQLDLSIFRTLGGGFCHDGWDCPNLGRYKEGSTKPRDHEDERGEYISFIDGHDAIVAVADRGPCRAAVWQKASSRMGQYIRQQGEER